MKLRNVQIYTMYVDCNITMVGSVFAHTLVPVSQGFLRLSLSLCEVSRHTISLVRNYTMETPDIAAAFVNHQELKTNNNLI